MKLMHLGVALFTTSLIACGGGSGGSSNNSTSSSSSSVPGSASSSQGTSVSSSSSSASLEPASSSSSSSSSEPVSSSSSVSSSLPSAASPLPLLENFNDVVDADGFFSEGYKSLSASNQAFYFRVSGTPLFSDGRMRLPAARFTLGNTQPETTSAAGDTQTQGELDLSQAYRISFCVLDWEVTGSNKNLQLYVDNNTSAAANSIHGSSSRIHQVAVDTLTRGERVVVESSLGSATSYLQLRTESGAVVVLDDLWIGYQADTSTEPSAQSCAGYLVSSSSSSSSSSSGSNSSSAPMLSQTNNPVYTELNNYKSWLSSSGDAAAKLAADKTRADNMISWQLPHGGFYKFDVSKYNNPWNGSESRSDWRGANNVELGTIDNDATVSELLFLADVYRRSGDSKYRDAARRAMDFILTMQYASGGWPQVYPARTGTTYSNHVTFNDDAMARVLILLDQSQKAVAPLDGDLFSGEQLSQIEAAINKGVDFIVNAQIEQNGVKTVWCAQHDPVTYVPRGARSYELPSKSGKESVLVVAFLMTRPQTPEVEASVKAALAWYRSDSVKVANTAYIKRSSGSTDDSYNPIQPQSGSTMWYRFYDVDADTGFFSGRLSTDNPPGTGKQYDIMEIEPERRYGYEWGGDYGTKILNYAQSVGY
ncbi:pectate lyase [Cellvibrio japonicus]|nr:pectate lyase [Cellvibrio japonicus]